MLIDSGDIPYDSVINTDVCIVGAGAAGITLARQFANTNIRVCLMESGGFNLELPTQNLYKGSNVGWPYWPLDSSRIRFFGGTTNHWGGNCIPLNDDDFEQRDWISDSGWPISKTDLEPYYRAAQPVFGLGQEGYDPVEWQSDSMKLLEFSDDLITSNMFQGCEAKRFGAVYRAELLASSNLDTYLHANAIDIQSSENGKEIVRIKFACLNGNRFTVNAKTYLLALGGLENSRLLLASNGVQSKGLANGNDLVGRYFSDHYYFARLGLMVVPEANPNLNYYHKKIRVSGREIGLHFELASAVKKKKKLLSTRIHISKVPWRAYSHDPGKPAINRDFGEKVASKLNSVWQSLSGLEKPNKNRPESYGELSSANLYSIGAWIEVNPRKDSRVYLNDDKDVFGMPRITLDWIIANNEKRSLMTSLNYFARQVGANGIGRVRLDLDEQSPWPWQGGGEPGLHQMGGTRMNDSALKGVVDKHCKVHGIANLYIAGSSVFPTFGTANPTLTIVALALRLADHVKEIQSG